MEALQRELDVYEEEYHPNFTTLEEAYAKSQGYDPYA
jgi:hypothetical protein